jgi:hypothetical protein
MGTRDAGLSQYALGLEEHRRAPDLAIRLWEQFDAGTVTVEDLRLLLPEAWTSRDRPEQVIGATKWVDMFRAAGFLASSRFLPEPRLPSWLLFRGATAQRARGMAWYLRREDADNTRGRHAGFGPPLTYATRAPDRAVLAMFQRPGEGTEVVVEPWLLGRIWPLTLVQSA